MKDTLLYNIVLISAIHHRESTIGIHMSPPSNLLPIPRLQVVPEHWVEPLSHTANSHWPPILHMVMHMFPCYSLHLSHSLHPPLCSQVKSRVLNLQALMPEVELRFNNNRNKAHNRCNALELSLHHPLPLVHGKTLFHETVPGARKVGDCWL